MDELKPPGDFQRHLSPDSCPGYSLTSAVVHYPRTEGVYAGRTEVLESVARLRAESPRTREEA